MIPCTTKALLFYIWFMADPYNGAIGLTALNAAIIYLAVGVNRTATRFENFAKNSRVVLRFRRRPDPRPQD